LSFRRIVDIPFHASVTALANGQPAGQRGEPTIGHSLLRGPVDRDPGSGTYRIEVRLARGPLRRPLRMRLDIDHWCASASALELIPCRRVRPTAAYFRAGHRLLDALTCWLLQQPAAQRLAAARQQPAQQRPPGAAVLGGAVAGPAEPPPTELLPTGSTCATPAANPPASDPQPAPSHRWAQMRWRHLAVPIEALADPPQRRLGHDRRAYPDRVRDVRPGWLRRERVGSARRRSSAQSLFESWLENMLYSAGDSDGDDGPPVAPGGARVVAVGPTWSS